MTIISLFLETLDVLTRKSLYSECIMRVVDYRVNYVCGILNRSETISRSLWKLKSRLLPNNNKSSEINNYFCVHTNISFILCSFGSSHNLSYTYPPRV